MQKFPILLFVLLVSYATRAEYRKPRNATKLSDTSALNIIPLPFNAHQTTGSFYFNKQTALRFSENPDEQTLSVFPALPENDDLIRSAAEAGGRFQ